MNTILFIVAWIYTINVKINNAFVLTTKTPPLTPFSPSSSSSSSSSLLLQQEQQPCTTKSFQHFMSSSSSSSANNENNDDEDDFFSNIRVMVNGMPGPMATSAAEACLRKGLLLSPIAMTGPDIPSNTISVIDSLSGRSSEVHLIPSSSSMDEMTSALTGLKAAYENESNEDRILLLVIDFTHPMAVNSNAQFYIKHNLPFVMGTTGGDRSKLISDVQSSNLHAVIAPNMAKQIVAMQYALEDLSKKFPSAFEGYSLSVRESHQKTKADTSGTAKAIVQSLKILNNNNNNNNNNDNDDDTDEEEDDTIIKLRSDKESLDFGVPKNALSGHAFHTYTLTSMDGTVEFQLKHNVIGRTVYGDGTADAIKFLARKVVQQKQQQKGSDDDKNEKNRIYTMIDVLQEGAME